MQILVVAATELEIRPFAEAGTGADVLITGVGLPATLYHLLKRLHQIDYDLVIQAGIAGTYNDHLPLGKTYWVNRDTFGDLGMEEKENFNSVFESGFADKNEFPFKNGWLLNEHEVTKRTSLQPVSAVTVNRVTDSKLQEQQVRKAFDPDIESMEGAALHYVCLQEHIPFIQLRAVSNIVGERNKANWKIQEAITDLNYELRQLINQLSHKPINHP